MMPFEFLLRMASSLDSTIAASRSRAASGALGPAIGRRRDRGHRFALVEPEADVVGELGDLEEAGDRAPLLEQDGEPAARRARRGQDGLEAAGVHEVELTQVEQDAVAALALRRAERTRELLVVGEVDLAARDDDGDLAIR